MLASYPTIKYKVLARLIVPVAKLAKTHQDAEKPDNLSHKYYAYIENMMQEARKEHAEENGGAK